jgi:hypothetical protein
VRLDLVPDRVLRVADRVLDLAPSLTFRWRWKICLEQLRRSSEARQVSEMAVWIGAEDSDPC